MWPSETYLRGKSEVEVLGRTEGGFYTVKIGLIDELANGLVSRGLLPGSVELELAKVEPHESVFVGDNLLADITGAQNMGMRGVWRRTDREESLSDDVVTPDGTIDTLHDLLPLLDTWYPGWRNGHTA